jgi:hypothetical protein
VTDWSNKAKRLLRAEMLRKDATYADLCRALDAIGITDSEANLRNKVSRGSFSAAFMLQCLAALDVETLHLDD